MRTTRRLYVVPLAVPLAVVLAGGLAACGGPGADREAPVAQTTASAVAEEVVEEAPAEDAPVDLTPETLTKAMISAQTAAGSYDVSVLTTSGPESRFGETSVQMDGSVKLLDGRASVVMKVVTPGLEAMETRVIDRVMYLNMGSTTQGKFLRVDMDDPSDPVAASMRGFDVQFDIRATLEAQVPAILNVTPLGEPEEIDGVMAQAYVLVTDLTLLPPDMVAMLEESQAVSGINLPDTLTETYWIGPDRLIRKSVSEIKGMRTERLFTNWGKGGLIEAPPEDQILSPEDLIT